MKICKKCNKEKPLSSFYKAVGCKDGLRTDCKSCNNNLRAKNALKNPLKRKVAYKKHYSRNKHLIKEKIKHKKSLDEVFALKNTLKASLKTAFNRKQISKNSKTAGLLGCDFKELLAHLLKTFKINYGRDLKPTDTVHIDHIIPNSSAKTLEEFKKLQHYTNLQYLLAADNLAKGNRLDYQSPWQKQLLCYIKPKQGAETLPKED